MDYYMDNHERCQPGILKTGLTRVHAQVTCGAGASIELRNSAVANAQQGQSIREEAHRWKDPRHTASRFHNVSNKNGPGQRDLSQGKTAFVLPVQMLIGGRKRIPSLNNSCDILKSSHITTLSAVDAAPKLS